MASLPDNAPTIIFEKLHNCQIFGTSPATACGSSRANISDSTKAPLGIPDGLPHSQGLSISANSAYSTGAKAPAGIPDGLPDSQALSIVTSTTYNASKYGGSYYLVWVKNMLDLFRAHGVLEIMKDAVDPEARAKRKEKLELDEDNLGVVLSGAKKLTTADLDVWDHSDDMTLLLRANALINGSISGKAALWVANINNPHQKWEALRQWLEDEAIACVDGMKSQFNSISSIKQVYSGEGYVNDFMRCHSGLAAHGVFYSDEDSKRRLVKGFLKGLSKNKLRPDCPVRRQMEREASGEVSCGDGASLQRFALDFVKRAVEARENCGPQDQWERAPVEDKAKL